MAHERTSFLHLPIEVRLQIYDLAVVPARLCIRPILDPGWLFIPDRGCCVSPLLFASKQIYREVAPIFYSRATFEMTPCQRDPSDGRKLSEFLQQHEDDHAFCPPEFLSLVENVHVYSDHSWPIDQDSFQALFRWLVTKTNARHIYLSRRTMQQARHIPELVCLSNLEYDMMKQSDATRIIDIYARNVSSRLRFMEGKNCLPGRTKPWPEVQLYLNLKDSTQSRLYREPRWDLLASRSESRCEKEELLKKEMERFAGETLPDMFLRQTHADGYLWLYKTIQIQRRIENCTQDSQSSIAIRVPINVS